MITTQTITTTANVQTVLLQTVTGRTKQLVAIILRSNLFTDNQKKVVADWETVFCQDYLVQSQVKPSDRLCYLLFEILGYSNCKKDAALFQAIKELLGSLVPAQTNVDLLLAEQEKSFIKKQEQIRLKQVLEKIAQLKLTAHTNAKAEHDALVAHFDKSKQALIANNTHFINQFTELKQRADIQPTLEKTALVAEQLQQIGKNVQQVSSNCHITAKLLEQFTERKIQ